jgi:hypothetical protein
VLVSDTSGEARHGERALTGNRLDRAEVTDFGPRAGSDPSRSDPSIGWGRVCRCNTRKASRGSGVRPEP